MRLALGLSMPLLGCLGSVADAPEADASRGPSGDAAPRPATDEGPALDGNPAALRDADPAADANPAADAGPVPVADAGPEPVADARPAPVADARPAPVADARPAPVDDAAVLEPDGPPNQPPDIGRYWVEGPNYATDCETRVYFLAEDPDGRPEDLTLAYDTSEPVEIRGDAVVFPAGASRAVRIQVTVTDAEGAEGGIDFVDQIEACQPLEGTLPSPDGQRAYAIEDSAPNGGGPNSNAIHRLLASLSNAWLVVVDDQAELDLLAELFGDAATNAMIGLNRKLDPPDQFEWMSGEVNDFSAWCGDQPDDFEGMEDAVQLWFPDGPSACWNDVDPMTPAPAIWEFRLPTGPDEIGAGGRFARPSLMPGRVDHMVFRTNVAVRARFQTADDGEGCPVGDDTVLELRVGGQRLAWNDDIEPGQLCSSVTLNLPPGA